MEVPARPSIPVSTIFSSSVTTNFYSKYRINKNSFLSSISFKKYGNLHMGKNRMHGYENWGIEEFATHRNEQLYET